MTNKPKKNAWDSDRKIFLLKLLVELHMKNELEKQMRNRKIKNHLKTTVLLSGLAVLLAQIYSLLGRYWWGFELFTHYAVHIFFAAILVFSTVTGLIFLEWKKTARFQLLKNIPILLAMTAVIGVQSWNFLPYMFGNGNSTATGPTLKILSANFLVINSDFETIQKVIAEEKPDIVQIVEADYAWREQKKIFEADYPYIAISEMPGAMGYVLASKFPAEFYPFELAGYQSLETELTINGSPLRIFTVHTFPPSRADLAEIRNAQFEELAAQVEQNIPTIAIGDFNSSPWSPFFKDLLAETALRDAALGFGIVNTWHSRIPFLKIPIDHALVSPEIEVLDFYKTQDIGSDHYPIVVTIRLP